MNGSSVKKGLLTLSLLFVNGAFASTMLKKQGYEVKGFNSDRDSTYIDDLYSKNAEKFGRSFLDACFYVERLVNPKKMKEGKRATYVLRKNEKTIGFVTFDYYQKVGSVKHMAILEKERRHGYGTVLGKRAIEKLFNIGCNNVRFCCWNYNGPMHKLAKKCKFQEKGSSRLVTVYEMTRKHYVDLQNLPIIKKEVQKIIENVQARFEECKTKKHDEKKKFKKNVGV
ncbi:GNAT family N-acetyltransferase [bacterium]|nr:GNAT family N-acetyltransferase [bacterium]